MIHRAIAGLWFGLAGVIPLLIASILQGRLAAWSVYLFSFVSGAIPGLAIGVAMAGKFRERSYGMAIARGILVGFIGVTMFTLFVNSGLGNPKSGRHLSDLRGILPYLILLGWSYIPGPMAVGAVSGGALRWLEQRILGVPPYNWHTIYTDEPFDDVDETKKLSGILLLPLSVVALLLAIGLSATLAYYGRNQIGILLNEFLSADSRRKREIASYLEEKAEAKKGDKPLLKSTLLDSRYAEYHLPISQCFLRAAKDHPDAGDKDFILDCLKKYGGVRWVIYLMDGVWDDRYLPYLLSQVRNKPRSVDAIILVGLARAKHNLPRCPEGVVPALEEALQDENPRVRDAASEALRNIGP